MKATIESVNYITLSPVQLLQVIINLTLSFLVASTNKETSISFIIFIEAMWISQTGCQEAHLILEDVKCPMHDGVSDIFSTLAVISIPYNPFSLYLYCYH